MGWSVTELNNAADKSKLGTEELLELQDKWIFLLISTNSSNI